MWFARRSACWCVAWIVLGTGAASALSTLRPGAPRIRFNRLVAPDKAAAGDEFKVVAFITPLQNIWDDEKIFFHLLKPDAAMSEYPAQGWEQKGIVVNANAMPQVPAQRWIVGEDVQLGPITIELSRDLAPGKYLYQIGLFSITDPAKKIFMREPYANQDIKDWIVGSIEVTAPQQARNGSRVEVMLSDFETLGDVKKWESGRRGELGLVGAEEALDGNYSGCLAFPANSYLPIVMLQSFFESAPPEYTDWEQYDYLEFLFRGEFSPRAYNGSRISIQVKDIGGSRFQRSLIDLEKMKLDSVDRAALAAGTEGAGEKGSEMRTPTPAPARRAADAAPAAEKEAPGGTLYRFRVPIVDIASRVDVGNIGHFGFWAWGLPENEEWFLTSVIDDIKLVAEKGKKPEWTEPFVVFENLECPPVAYPGSAIRMSTSFTIARKFRQDYALFIHVIREDPPHFAMHVERNPFRSTSTWEVGRLHTEGPIYVPVPQDAPPGNYFVNVGLFKIRDEINRNAHYVNAYQWSDGIFTEEQPTLPVDYIKQPYLNRNSKQKWTVGSLRIVPRGSAKALPEIADEKKEMQGLVQSTEKDILSKPAPQPEEIPADNTSGVKRLERPTPAADGGTEGD